MLQPYGKKSKKNMAASHVVKVRTLFYNMKTWSISSYTFVLNNSQADIIKHRQIYQK